MRVIHLLSLVASATAVDVGLYYNQGCTGVGAIWYRVEPGTCLQTGAGWASARFWWIPTDWNLACKIYTNTQCPNGGPHLARVLSGGSTEVCMMHPDPNWKGLKGARYDFPLKKRSGELVARDEGPTEGQPCVGPDALLLEDGTTFAVAGLESQAVTEMVVQLSSGIIPESLSAFRTESVQVGSGDAVIVEIEDI